MRKAFCPAVFAVEAVRREAELESREAVPMRDRGALESSQCELTARIIAEILENAALRKSDNW